MESVKISPKFQVVIPAKIRESLDLKPGQKMHVLSYQNRVEFIPVMDIKKSKGMFKGINTGFERDKDRL
jgi:AbrB family looped-hinge helix DNA binding protein